MSDFASPSDIITALTTAGNGGDGCRQIGLKAAVTTVAAYHYSSWLASGFNGSGAIPTTWAVPTNATFGAWVPVLNGPTGATTNRLLYTLVSTNVTGVINLEDRIGHMGGLSGTVTTAQTVSATLTAQAASGRCSADGSDVQWWLEWYTATGSTAVNANISYTNQAGTSGKTAVIVVVASTPASRRYPIVSLAAGDTSIKSIESITLSASSQTAGNFGVTATKLVTNIFNLYTNNQAQSMDWAALGMPEINPSACLCGAYFANATSVGPVQYQIVVGSH